MAPINKAVVARPEARDIAVIDSENGYTKLQGSFYVSHVGLTQSENHQRVTLVPEDKGFAHERFNVIIPKDAEAPSLGTRVVNPTIALLTARDKTTQEIVALEPQWAEPVARTDGQNTPALLYYPIALIDADQVLAGADAAGRSAGVFARAKQQA